MTIYLSLILQTTWIQKQFSLSLFVFIDSFGFLCFTRRSLRGREATTGNASAARRLYKTLLAIARSEVAREIGSS